MSEVTCILSAIEQGDPRAAGQLLPLVYAELRQLAAQKLAQEKPGQTLQATALVHEAYLRLVDVEKTQHWDSLRHALFGRRRRCGGPDAASPASLRLRPAAGPLDGGGGSGGSTSVANASHETPSALASSCAVSQVGDVSPRSRLLTVCLVMPQ
jgi:hypothetical protein